MRQTTGKALCLLLVFHFVFPPLILSKDRLAVMSLKARKATEQPLADTVSVEIRNQIHKLELYEVVSQEDVDALAERTTTLQKLGCDDNQCLITFGNQLQSRFMIAGTLAKLDEKYHVGVRLLDTGGEDPGVKAMASRACSCSEDELLKVGRVLGVQLIQNYYKGSLKNKDLTPEALKANTAQLIRLDKILTEVKDENVIDEDRSFFWRYKWWILGGVAVIAGGAAAAGGGGGSSSSGDIPQQPAGTQKGNVSVSW